MLTSLTDEEHGRFLVTTECGTAYTVDLDFREVRRVAGPRPAAIFRRDGETVSLIEVIRCVLGLPMLLMVDLVVPGVWITTRETTRVTSIGRVTSGRLTRAWPKGAIPAHLRIAVLGCHWWIH